MGTKITFSKSYLSLASEATIKCPIWMGSKVPPKMPILLNDVPLGFTQKMTKDLTVPSNLIAERYRSTFAAEDLRMLLPESG